MSRGIVVAVGCDGRWCCFAAAMSTIELELLYTYLPYNLNIDEAAFRRQLVTGVHTVLTRLRNSSLLLLRRTAGAEKSPADVLEAVGLWHSSCSLRYS